MITRTACAIALTVGCGKAAEKSETTSESATTKTVPAAPLAEERAALATKPLTDLPLQADLAPSWKMQPQKVDPGGGVVLASVTGSVMIVRDGVSGIKKMTLEDTRDQIGKESPPAEDIREEKLADGWVLAYKTPGILPQHAYVVRTIDGATYRCVITTEEADEQQAGIDVCKSMRPST